MKQKGTIPIYEDYRTVLTDDYLFSRYANNIDFIYSNYWSLETVLNRYVETETIDKVTSLSDKDLLVLTLYLYKANKSCIRGFSIIRLHSYNKLLKQLDENLWNRRFRQTPFMYCVKYDTDRLFSDEQLENEYVHHETAS